MKLFAASQVKEIDSHTIAHEPVSSADLMERAATRLAGWYVRHFHIDRRVVVFAGPGNNGGDALAMARLLSERQYRVACYLLRFGSISDDCGTNRKRLLDRGLAELTELQEGDELPNLSGKDVVVDGIFGSGLSRIASGFPGKVIRHLNASPATVIAIDIPSGLFGEDNSDNDPDAIVRADYTLTFQFPFLSFFFRMNSDFVGSWRVQDIQLHPDAIRQAETDYRTSEQEEIAAMFSPRKTFSHKGTYGHALVISGRTGMMGAALLTAEACLRSGPGLVSLHIPNSANSIVQTAFPEAIVSLDPSDRLFSSVPVLDPYSAVGVGPGIGKDKRTGQALKELLTQAGSALVIDADGLNLLAQHPEWMELVPEGSVLTPHPREFDRLAGESGNDWQRHLKQREFAREYGVIVVLKGAYTGIASPDGGYWFNTTGNPGMATGGSGDVLTGMITGFMAQGLRPLDAARAGVYLHGLAGDLCLKAHTPHTMIAGDMIQCLAAAFRETGIG